MGYDPVVPSHQFVGLFLNKYMDAVSILIVMLQKSKFLPLSGVTGLYVVVCRRRLNFVLVTYITSYCRQCKEQ